jgi:type IV secretory pathway VirB9-like protein
MKLPLVFAAMVLAGCAAAPPPPQIIVQHDLAPPPKPVIPPDPYAALPPDIAAAIKAGDTTTVFRHNTDVIYPYSPDKKYAVNCQPNMAVQIRLRDDENTDENNAVLGDSVRWSIKIGMHTVLLKPLGTNRAISIQKTLPGGTQQNPVPATFDTRPPDPDMVTNLTIMTTKGRYYELIVRIRKPFTDAVSWYYTQAVQQEYAAHEAALKQVQTQ